MPVIHVRAIRRAEIFKPAKQSDAVSKKDAELGTESSHAGIALDAVSFSLDGHTIFDDLSLSLTEKRVGLIGRNGSGKSTLSRLICGLIESDAGSISVMGADPHKDRGAALRSIGLIFQNPDHQIIFPTVEEEIAFGLESLTGDKREARDRARAVLARFGRQDWAEKGTYMLSQGQRHLVCLLSVLAMEPHVIIADEPFAGLDMPTAHQLFQWLDGLEQQLVLVTHDIDRLSHFDQIVWLEEGKVEMTGAPETVLPAYSARMQKLAREADLGLTQELAPELAPKTATANPHKSEEAN